MRLGVILRIPYLVTTGVLSGGYTLIGRAGIGMIYGALGIINDVIVEVRTPNLNTEGKLVLDIVGAASPKYISVPSTAAGMVWDALFEDTPAHPVSVIDLAGSIAEEACR